MPLNLTLPSLGSLKIPGIKAAKKVSEEPILQLPDYTELPTYGQVVRRKTTDTFETTAPNEALDVVPEFNRRSTDPLVGGSSKVDKKYDKWLRNEQAQWRKAVAKGETTDDFDTWLFKKDKARRKAERQQALLNQQLALETREINQGVRTSYSAEVQHLAPNPYGYGYMMF